MSFNYYLFRIFIFPIAFLPLRILYLLSSIIAVLNNVFLNYRKEVVIENLKNAFPEKSQQELDTLYKQFFSHFIDTLIETFKMLEKRPGFLPKHVHITNPELLESYFRAGKSVIAVGGHYGNWEWLGTVLGDITPYKALGVYKPLSNKVIDRVMLSIRSVNHSVMVPMKSIVRVIAKSDQPILTFLIADQAPDPDHAYWTNFLNQDTPVYLGPEKIAKASDHAVVFLAMNLERRGYYSVTVSEISSHPNSAPPHSITEKHVRALENQIIQKPAYWLWSHKRWKHTRTR